MTGSATPRPLFDASNTGPTSRLLFHHLSRLVHTATKRRLEQEDVYNVGALASVPLWSAFSASWAAELGKKKPSLGAAVGAGTLRTLLVTALMHLVGLGCNFAQPLMLQQIVGGLACSQHSSDCPPAYTLYKWAGVLAMCTVVNNVLTSHERIALSLVGVRIRNQLMAAVYRKTLRLSSGALQTESAGRIVTLMSNDCQKISEFIVMSAFSFRSPSPLLFSLLSRLCSQSTRSGRRPCSSAPPSGSSTTSSPGPPS